VSSGLGGLKRTTIENGSYQIRFIIVPVLTFALFLVKKVHRDSSIALGEYRGF
jgi:hypothetical protein